MSAALMNLGTTMDFFKGKTWADAMDIIDEGWNTKPAKGALVRINFTGKPKDVEERFNDVFLEAWGDFAIRHKADGVNRVAAYINKGRWRKMKNAASMIMVKMKKNGLDETTIFNISNEELHDYFIQLFEELYGGFQYKGEPGVGADVTHDEFLNQLVEKITVKKGGARKRKTQRKLSRKTQRKLSRKTGRKTGRKAGRKTGRKAGRKTGRKAGRKTHRKH